LFGKFKRGLGGLLEFVGGVLEHEWTL